MPIWKEFYCKTCNEEVRLPRLYQHSQCPASLEKAGACGEKQQLHVPHTALLSSASRVKLVWVVAEGFGLGKKSHRCVERSGRHEGRKAIYIAFAHLVVSKKNNSGML